MNNALRKLGCSGALLLVGLLIVTPSLGLPIARLLQTASWTESTCTIESLHWQRNEPRVRYEFVIDDVAYEGRHLDLSPMHGGDDLRVDVSDLRPGARVPCFVADDPPRAVLRRDFGNMAGFFLCCGGVPLGLGVLGVLFRLFGRLPEAPDPERREFVQDNPDPVYAAKVHALLAVVLDTLFVLVALLPGDSVLYCELAGLGIAGGYVTFIGLPMFVSKSRNPRVKLVLSGPLVVGQSTEMMWFVEGNVERLASLEIRLRGHRPALGNTDQDGTIELHQAVLVSSQGPWDGVATIDIPPDLPETCWLPGKVVHWKLEIDGDVPEGADIKTRHEVHVGL